MTLVWAVIFQEHSLLRICFWSSAAPVYSSPDALGWLLDVGFSSPGITWVHHTNLLLLEASYAPVVISQIGPQLWKPSLFLPSEHWFLWFNQHKCEQICRIKYDIFNNICYMMHETVMQIKLVAQDFIIQKQLAYFYLHIFLIYVYIFSSKSA